MFLQCVCNPWYIIVKPALKSLSDTSSIPVISPLVSTYLCYLPMHPQVYLVSMDIIFEVFPVLCWRVIVNESWICWIMLWHSGSYLNLFLLAFSHPDTSGDGEGITSLVPNMTEAKFASKFLFINWNLKGTVSLLLPDSGRNSGFPYLASWQEQEYLITYYFISTWFLPTPQKRWFHYNWRVM